MEEWALIIGALAVFGTFTAISITVAGISISKHFAIQKQIAEVEKQQALAEQATNDLRKWLNREADKIKSLSRNQRKMLRVLDMLKRPKPIMDPGDSNSATSILDAIEDVDE